MTSRYEKLALSHFQENIYTENITVLKEFNEIVYGITVVRNGKWKPFQSGLVHCTQTALDIQHEYLNKQNFKYLFIRQVYSGCVRKFIFDNTWANICIRRTRI